MTDKLALPRILEGIVHTEEKNKHSEEAAENKQTNKYKTQ